MLILRAGQAAILLCYLFLFVFLNWLVLLLMMSFLLSVCMNLTIIDPFFLSVIFNSLFNVIKIHIGRHSVSVTRLLLVIFASCAKGLP